MAEALRARSPRDFRYFFKSFLEEGDQTFMLTNFRNENACFDVKLLVDRWDKLVGMRRTNGVSYPSELYDLRLEVVAMPEGVVVRYVDMHAIID